MSRHIELNNELMIKKDGFYQLDKDLEAVKEFEKEVRQRMVYFITPLQRIHWMVDNDFYYNVFDQYTEDEILRVHKLAWGYSFQYRSYMAISKFYNDYALKTNDKSQFLEFYEDRVVIAALFLGRGDIESALRQAMGMIDQTYQPATPTFLNSGKARRGEMISCFLLGMGDSLNGINFNVGTAGQLSKIGGGVAINLSYLRGHGAEIKKIKKAATGIQGPAKLLEDTFSYVNQLGQRPGAGAIYLDMFHWDIEHLLDAKKINADEKVRLKKLSIGVIASNKFFELAEKNEPYYVFEPYSVYKAFGKHMVDMDMDEMYEKIAMHPDVMKKRLDARHMLTKIAQTQLESGYPYFMFKTNANKAHALKAIGTIQMSNLCTEIFQLQEISEINDYGVEDVIRRDINCTLGSLNIVNVMEKKKLRDAVHVGMESLTNVSEMSDIKNAPTIRKSMEELHPVGLGVMNLHGFLAKNRIMFESAEAKEFVRAFFAAMNFYSLEWSMQKARKSGPFKDFERSEYANGNYFTQYLEEDFNPKSDKVKKLFDGMDLPGVHDWLRLRDDVMEHGLFNAYRMAIAPTQSIGYIQNATASVMPIVDIIETRTYGNSTTYYPMPFLDQSTQWFYKKAFDMDMFKLIDLIAEMQRHIDQGISTILYVNSETSTRELARYYIYANKKGLKSLYYTRTKRTDIAECTSCSV